MSRSREMAKARDRSWLEVLPEHKIFDHLRDSCSGGSVNITFVRGNLFVWRRLNDALDDGEILTMNLNKLAAYPDTTDCYQILQCTKEFGEALELIADESGQYIAVHFSRGLTVVQLNYDRGGGIGGEFGGGKESVLCKNYSVAEPLFARYDQLRLLQVSWYPSSPDTLALLTSDNFIRLYSLADPECALLALPLLPQSAQRGGFRIEEDNVVRFCIHDTSAFVLHDTGDISLISMNQDSRDHRPRRLPMVLHSSDDNEEIDSSTMLLLDTSPSILIVAYKSGMIYHCMYFGDNTSEDQEEGKPPSLYVRERIQIESSRMEQDGADLDMTLTLDPADPHSYFVTSVEGIYLVRLPWAELLEQYAASTSNYTQISHGVECEVTHLLHTELSPRSLLGMVAVYESALGYAMISVTSGEWECMTLSLKEPMQSARCLAVLDGGFGDEDDEEDEVESSMTRTTGDNFVKTVENILHPPRKSTAPILKSVAKNEVELTSQKELYSFLQSRISEMKVDSVSRQMAALAVIEKKIEMLQRLKEQIITYSVELRDKADIIREDSDDLKDKLRDVIETNIRLMGKAEKLACKIRFLSPVLSEAEECMKNEMEGIHTHIQQMAKEVHRAHEKSKLFKIMTVHPEIDLSEVQSTTLLKELTASGDKIKSLSALVKILCDLMRPC